MHGDALTAAIDAWLAALAEECEIEVEKRDRHGDGQMLVVVADDNPWEDHDAVAQEVAVIPPRDGKTRVLFLGGGHDEARGLSYAYFNVQTSLGEMVDVSDQHRINVWIGPEDDDAARAEIRRRYESAVIEGIWEHLISAEHLIKAIAPSTPLGPNVLDFVARINRRIA